MENKRLHLSNNIYRVLKNNCGELNKHISDKEQKIITHIKAIVIETNNSYGKRRIRLPLVSKGVQVEACKTATLMEKANVIAIRPIKRHSYPAGEIHEKAANILNRNFNPGSIHTHWVDDITYIKTYTGWSYLDCVLDLGSREIMGWALSEQPNAKLAKLALQNAIKKQQPETQHLIFHSDQGVQYSANIFVNYLNSLKITQSMSRRGNC